LIGRCAVQRAGVSDLGWSCSQISNPEHPASLPQRVEKTRGRFFLQRPGRLRFDYAGQSGISLIADGKSVVIYNKKLKTSRLYALSAIER
jgi:hypothetical protein